MRRPQSPQYVEYWGSLCPCLAPTSGTPATVAALRRLSAQPRDRSSCLQWWTVDVFVTASGAIRAVTLDVWEP